MTTATALWWFRLSLRTLVADSHSQMELCYSHCPGANFFFKKSGPFHQVPTASESSGNFSAYKASSHRRVSHRSPQTEELSHRERKWLNPGLFPVPFLLAFPDKNPWLSFSTDISLWGHKALGVVKWGSPWLLCQTDISSTAPTVMLFIYWLIYVLKLF